MSKVQCFSAEILIAFRKYAASFVQFLSPQNMLTARKTQICRWQPLVIYIYIVRGEIDTAIKFCFGTGCFGLHVTLVRFVY